MKHGILALLLLGCALPAVAASRNDIPSCYAFAELTAAKPSASSRELVVVVDETTPLTLDLKKEALSHVLRFTQAGDRVKIYRFSAFLPDSHMKLEFAGELETALDEQTRNATGQASLKKLDTCLKQQMAFFQNTVAKRLGASFGDSEKQIAKSEILYSLKRIGDDWRNSPSSERVLFMVSDMLENSDYASFYQNNQIRELDPKAEMAKVSKHELQADFNGARVFVHAAGLVPNNVKHGYRSGKVMQSIERFWRDYFTAAGATLAGFGAPSLTTDLN